MAQTTETSRVLAKTVSDLAKNLLALSEALLQQGSFEGNSSKGKNSDGKDEEVKHKKKKKAERDPNAPKRNLSSYMLYSQSVRPKTVQEHPDLKAVDIAKLIGEMWNALSEKEKLPFVKQAEKEKARFDKETENYKNSLNESADSAEELDSDADTGKSDTKRKSTSSGNDVESKKKVKKEHDSSSSKKKSKKKN